MRLIYSDVIRRSTIMSVEELCRLIPPIDLWASALKCSIVWSNWFVSRIYQCWRSSAPVYLPPKYARNCKWRKSPKFRLATSNWIIYRASMFLNHTRMVSITCCNCIICIEDNLIDLIRNCIFSIITWIKIRILIERWTMLLFSGNTRIKI